MNPKMAPWRRNAYPARGVMDMPTGEAEKGTTAKENEALLQKGEGQRQRLFLTQVHSRAFS